MIHRTKPFNGQEQREIYRNCTHLKLTNIKGKESSSIRPEQLPLGIFSDTRYDIPKAIEAINIFLDTFGRHENNHSATVHTLYCTLDEYYRQCRESEESTIQSSCNFSLHEFDLNRPFFSDSNDIMRNNSSSYVRYVDSLIYEFGWSAFFCRIRFCDTLSLLFFFK
jgi:hypothetical protein